MELEDEVKAHDGLKKIASEMDALKASIRRTDILVHGFQLVEVSSVDNACG